MSTRQAQTTSVRANALDVAELYHAQNAVVQQSVRKVCGPDLARDVAQEAFVSLWLSQSSYDPAKGTMKSLLFGIARNEAIDAARRRSAQVQRDTRWLQMWPRPENEDASEGALRRVRLDFLLGLLRELRAELQEPIQLAFFAELSYREVASYLGLAEGTVKSRIRAGLQQMRILAQERMVLGEL